MAHTDFEFLLLSFTAPASGNSSAVSEGDVGAMHALTQGQGSEPAV